MGLEDIKDVSQMTPEELEISARNINYQFMIMNPEKRVAAQNPQDPHVESLRTYVGAYQQNRRLEWEYYKTKHFAKGAITTAVVVAITMFCAPVCNNIGGCDKSYHSYSNPPAYYHK